jgi:hypothetical protein
MKNSQLDRTTSPPLASNTKKRRRESSDVTRTPLHSYHHHRLHYLLHCGTKPTGLPRLEEEEEGRLWDRGLKTHGSAHLMLALLKSGKSLIHLLMRLVDESIVGAAHGN